MKEKRYQKITFTLSDSERSYLDSLVIHYNSSGLRITASDIIRRGFLSINVTDSSICSL